MIQRVKIALINIYVISLNLNEVVRKRKEYVLFLFSYLLFFLVLFLHETLDMKMNLQNKDYICYIKDFLVK